MLRQVNCDCLQEAIIYLQRLATPCIFEDYEVVHGILVIVSMSLLRYQNCIIFLSKDERQIE
jgi:hypothetical protein